MEFGCALSTIMRYFLPLIAEFNEKNLKQIIIGSCIIYDFFVCVQSILVYIENNRKTSYMKFDEARKEWTVPNNMKEEEEKMAQQRQR